MTVHPLRALNRSRVLNALIDLEYGLRPVLAQRLGLSLMAVTRITRELADVGLVVEGGKNVRSEPGRRPTELAIDPSGAYVLGFEVHAFRQSLVLMDLSRRVTARKLLHLSSPTNGPVSLSEFTDQAKSVIRSAGIDPQRVMGAGVAVTGVVDRDRGSLIDAPYLGWSSLAIASMLQARLDMPVVVDRIANALLSAESNAPPLLRNALLFNIGFAMSAAFLVDGGIAHGSRLMAGQVGHMASDDNSRTCSCGQQGCLNATASGWAALSYLGDVDDHVLSAEEFQRDRPKLADLLRREDHGEPAACQALRQVGQTLGRTIRQLQIALDPTRIFLSGPVGRAASFVEGARQGVGDALAALVIRCDRKVDEAAALMALDEFVRSPRLDFERLRKASAAGLNDVA